MTQNNGTQFQIDIRKRHQSNGYKFTDESRIGIRGIRLSGLKTETDSGKNDIVGIATNDTVDSSNEVVLPEGADLSYINSYKNLYADHYYGISAIIGVLRSLKPYKGGNIKGWEFRAALHKGMSYGVAEDLMIVLENGGDVGASIGFDALEYSSPNAKELEAYPGAECIIRRWKWIELSLTAMPCNMTCGAMLAPAQMEEKRYTFLEGLLSKGKIRRESAHALGLPDAGRITCLSFVRPKVLTFQRPPAQKV